MAQQLNNLEGHQFYFPALDDPVDRIAFVMDPQLLHNLYGLIALLHHHVMQMNQLLPGNGVPIRVVPIPQLEPDRANPADGINKLLALYVAAQGVIFNAAFFMEGRTGCEILWTPLILSGLVSLATIVATLQNFVQQFTQLGEDSYWRWVAQKVAFLVMLIAFSVCLLLSCTSVLCASGR